MVKRNCAKNWKSLQIFCPRLWVNDNLPFFEYFRKIALTTCFRKVRRGRDSSPSSLLILLNLLIFVNPWTLKNNIYHSNKREPLPFFHSDTNLTLDHILVHSVHKIHALVVTVELTWLLLLNILSFNFVPTLNKFLSFTRFRRSYVNHPAVVLLFQPLSKLHCFFAWKALFKVATFPFL